MKDKIVDLIDKGKISIDEADGNIYIYEDCGSFFRMYYFFDGKTDALKIDVEDKDIVVEIPYSKSLNEQQLLQEKILKKNGFALERESSLMSVSAKTVHLPELNPDQNLVLKFGNKDDCDKYLELMYSRLNPLFSFLPDKEELLDLINKKCIICAYYDEMLVGVLNIEVVKNDVWARHLIISEEYLGRNIGNRLFTEGHRFYKNDCCVFKSWVDIHNIPGIKVHEKIGYKFDDRKANEYVRRTSVSGRQYDKLIVIGYGKVAFDIIKYLAVQTGKWNVELEYIEFEKTGLSNIQKYCDRKGIRSEKICDKEQLTEKLSHISQKTLIISAGNKYIFPKKIIDMPKVKIINFHNALLPAYPGRNALSWAIWNDEKYVGPTWHLVTNGVDAGDILWQERIPVGADSKAYELAGAVMKSAVKGFIAIIGSVLDDSYYSFKQQTTEKMYYSWERPNEGEISLMDEPDRIYRLLRSYDYGIEDVIGKVKLIYMDKIYEVIKYSISDEVISTKETSFDGVYFYIPLGYKQLIIKANAV
jgi:folate-dependent phosphoribosylglycinamide formyltransferase PurN